MVKADKSETKVLKLIEQMKLDCVNAFNRVSVICCSQIVTHCSFNIVFISALLSKSKELWGMETAVNSVEHFDRISSVTARSHSLFNELMKM